MIRFVRERNRNSFTLLELLVVIALVAVCVVFLLRHTRRIPRAYYEGKDQFHWMSQLHDKGPTNDKKAVTALCHILLEARFKCRCLILGSLGKAGPRARSAIPTLELMLQREQDQELRDDVLRTLEQIRAPAPERYVPEEKPKKSPLAGSASGNALTSR